MGNAPTTAERHGGWWHHSRQPRSGGPSWAGRHRRTLITIATIVAVLIALRLAIGPIAAWYARRVLNDTPGFGGSVQDIDIRVLRAGAVVRGLDIQSIAGETSTPLVSVPEMTMSLRWRALVHGRVVAQILLDRPLIRCDVAPKKADVPPEVKQEAKRRNGGSDQDSDVEAHKEIWQDKIARLTPITIDRITLRDAQIRLIDRAKHIDVSASSLKGDISNLTNVEKKAGDRVASLSLRGDTIGGARLAIDGSLDPLAKDPTFDLALQLEGLDLTALNPLLEAYAGLNVKQGRLDLYSEMDAKQQRLDGYAKPIITDLDVADVRQDVKDGGVLHAAKEVVAGAAAKVFQSHDQNGQQATRIDIGGPLDAPGTDVWGAVTNALRNAFVKALKPGLEHGHHGSG